MLENINGFGCCTCNWYHGSNCLPVKQHPFIVKNCDIDGKYNYPCYQRYPTVCFPLPGLGVINSICQNLTIHNS